MAARTDSRQSKGGLFLLNYEQMNKGCKKLKEGVPHNSTCSLEMGLIHGQKDLAEVLRNRRTLAIRHAKFAAAEGGTSTQLETRPDRTFA